MAKKEIKQFLVVGLGRFGTSITRSLFENGAEVLAVDINEERINEIEPYCTQAVCADASDEKVLEKLAINNFDVAIICIGTNIKSSIFVTLMCKQFGIKQIFAKAQDQTHKLVLSKVGADVVIIPEEEMGQKIAAQLVKPNIIEVLSLSSDFHIVEVVTPDKWQNKSLVELNLRNTENVSIIVIRRGDEIIVTPGGVCVLLPDDILMVAGTSASTKKLSNKATKNVMDAINDID